MAQLYLNKGRLREEAVKLSPLDIRHKEFQSALNGFNKGQVRDFLARAADQYEERLEQIQQLSEQIRKQEKEIEELRVSDIELKRTLVTSEKLSGEFKIQAEREAELLLKETQSKADIILRDAELQKRQLLKTAEMQVEEANSARQKAEEAAKKIRQRSIEEAAVQKQRAHNMVAGLKEQAAQSTATPATQNLETETLEIEHAKELAKLRHNSKSVIVQLKKDIAQLKAERGQMVEQLGAYDRNLEALEHKVAQQNTTSAKVSVPQKRPKRRETDLPERRAKQSPKPVSKLKTKQVANALSNSIDSLMSDSFLESDSLGLSPTKQRQTKHKQNNLQANNLDITYPKLEKTHTDKLSSDSISNSELMNITVTPINDPQVRQATGRYAQPRQQIKSGLTEQNKDLQNGLSQHIYPPYPVKESSVQDRGRLITPPTVYDVENPFIDDGFDELDSLSESMVEKDSVSDIKGIEFDSNIFNVEDTIEHVTSKATVENIEVLDTDWFENFELDDD